MHGSAEDREDDRSATVHGYGALVAWRRQTYCPFPKLLYDERPLSLCLGLTPICTALESWM